MSLLHRRLPIFHRFLEIGFEISACANSVYQAFLLPLLKRLGTRLETERTKGKINILKPSVVLGHSVGAWVLLRWTQLSELWLSKKLVNPFLDVAGYILHETFLLWHHFLQWPHEIGSATAERAGQGEVGGCIWFRELWCSLVPRPLPPTPRPLPCGLGMRLSCFQVPATISLSFQICIYWWCNVIQVCTSVTQCLGVLLLSMVTRKENRRTNVSFSAKIFQVFCENFLL